MLTDGADRASERYLDLVRRLQEAVLGESGVTEPSLRKAVEARAAGLSGRAGRSENVPPALTPFVDKVARRAFEVTRADVEALRRAGYSEDAIFETMASAALGAGLGRLERGLAALKGEV